LRFVFANSHNCFSLIDFTILFEAPLSEDFKRSPRFAASAAPLSAASLILQAYQKSYASPWNGLIRSSGSAQN